MTAGLLVTMCDRRYIIGVIYIYIYIYVCVGNEYDMKVDVFFSTRIRDSDVIEWVRTEDVPLTFVGLDKSIYFMSSLVF